MKQAPRFGTLASALAAAVLLSDCGFGPSSASSGDAPIYPIGGTVEGLDSGGGPASVVLVKNGVDFKTVSTNGSFYFATGLPFLSRVDVRVQTNPIGRTCFVIGGGSGTVFGVTSVSVACTSNASAPAPGDLVITEVMADPVGTDDIPKQWFEVVNLKANPLDLGGVVVARGPGFFVIPAGTSIPSAAFFVFGVDTAANGGLPRVDVNYGGTLHFVNTSVSLSITVAGTIIDAVNLGAMPSGASLALSQAKVDANQNDSLANWCISSTTYGAGGMGTPGAANSDCP